MGVYIPNMKMPQVCDERCPCFEDSGLDGCDCKWDGVLQFPVKKGKHSEQCPLIEIKTPHGRLIEERVFIDEIVSEHSDISPTEVWRLKAVIDAEE